MRRKITVEGNTLRFSAAHFTTFGGPPSAAEPLHGHNYDVCVEVEGDLTADAWVLDFVQLKAVVASLCRELDHRFLLPLASPHLTITGSDTAYEVRFQDRRYVMPKSDACPLPIDNSTAERLAEYLCQRLAQALHERGVTNVWAITVAVEEAPGQAGWCTLPLDPPPPRKEEEG